MKKPSISIITVSFNEEQHIQRLAHTVRRLDGIEEVDIDTVLVDGGSKDGTVDKARAAGFDQIVEIPNGTIPACRNEGALCSNGTWLAYLDADCAPETNWLRHVLTYVHEETPVIIGWPVLPPEQTTWIQRAWTFHWTSKNRQFTERNGRPVVLHEGFRLLTARNMIVHRSLFHMLQGFDERLLTGEDTDFLFRASCAKCEVVADPALRVRHHGEPRTLREFYRQQSWHANRVCYSRIFQWRVGMSGANAPAFAVLFLASLLVAASGITSAAMTRTTGPLAGLLPLLSLLIGPALMISSRGRSLRFILPLCALYFLYGLARSLDLAGFSRPRRSWKSS